MGLRQVKPLSLPTRILMVIYSMGWTLFGLLRPLLQRFSGEIKRQFAHRGISDQQLQAIRAERANHQRAAIFYCSSAGEYEQALPLMNRLGPEWYIHLFFSSVSGVEYATALGEKRPFHLSPIEGLQRWERVFNAIQPELIVVTRHGLWPAFLCTARQYGQLVAIDVAVRDNSGGLSRRIKTMLLNWFDQVFFVSEEDRRLLNDLHVPSQIAGNTKFDRAADRKRGRADEAAQLATEADRLLLPGKRLIAGSAWREDIQVILESHRILTGMAQEEWRLILVPHDVSPAMIDWIGLACRGAGLSVTRYSQKEQAGQPTEVLIVDTIGLLFEFYACADVALIGGGFQQGIHNIVEPAVFGLPLIAGPLAGSDREAMLYRSANLLEEVGDGLELAKWLSAVAHDPGDREKQIRARVLADLGASDLICSALHLAQAPASTPNLKPQFI